MNFYHQTQKYIFGRIIKKTCIFISCVTIIGGIFGFIHGAAHGSSIYMDHNKINGYQLDLPELSLVTFGSGISGGKNGIIIGFFSLITGPVIILNKIFGNE